MDYKNGPGRLLFSTSIIMIMLLVSSCSLFKGEQSSSIKEQVQSYYDKNIKYDAGTCVNAYFDFSDGLLVAYNNDSTKNMTRSIVNKITGDSTMIFSLANNVITKLDMHQTDLYNYIMDPKSYMNLNAPIEKTLNKIVSDGKSALLVTDFEEYTPDGKVQHQAFAKKYFEKWLSQGNDITFYVTNYIEDRLPKHLYFIVFDNKRHSLLNNIEESLTGYSSLYSKYTLSTNPWTFTTNYIAEHKGGTYHDASGEDLVTVTIEDGSDDSFTKLDDHAEYYPFGDNWENILKNANAMKEPGVPQPFTDIFRHLFVNLQNQDSYKIKGMGVKAYDIQADVDRYSLYETALKNKPTMKKNSNGAMIADLSGDAASYYNDKGEMLPDFVYKSQNPTVINDAFVLNQALFNNTFKSDPGKVELAIDFDSKFNGDMIGYNDGDLLRIDIVVTESEPNLSNIDKLFSWGANTSLSESIRNTLQDLNPASKCTPIYTYFIKTY